MGNPRAGKKTLRPNFLKRRDYSGMTWLERTFEEFRQWMIQSDERALKQNFFEANLPYIVLGVFGLIWVIIYFAQYGMTAVSVDDLQQCIPKRYRDTSHTVPPVQASTWKPKRKYNSSLVNRLAAGQPAQARGASRLPPHKSAMPSKAEIHPHLDAMKEMRDALKMRNGGN